MACLSTKGAEMEFVIYRGEKFYIQTTGRYFSSGRHGPNAKERLLHRRVWIDSFGPIPEGTEVHHLDEDWRNNDPKNLEVRSVTKNRQEHQLKRMADPEFRATALKALRDNSHIAAEWHASPEGLAWHKQNSEQAWAKREPVPKVCIICGAGFMAMFASRARFCSNSCEQKESRKRHPQISATCPQCGGGFTFSKYKKGGQVCCSRTCHIRRMHNHPPTLPDLSA